MTIGVLEISGATTPKGFLGGLDNFCSRFFGLRHYFIYLCFAFDIMADGKFRCACTSRVYPDIFGKTFPRIKCELHAVFQIKENNCAKFKFLSNDSMRSQTKSIAIELERLFQIIYA